MYKGSNYTPDEPTLLGVNASSSSEDLGLKVQQAQEQLLQLRRQQEELEDQKRALEELSRKQREFDEGRQDTLEKLTRGLVLLERQEHELHREAETSRMIREGFADQLARIQELNPEGWQSHNLPTELTRALATIDQAQAVYAQSRARLEAMRSPEELAAAEEDLAQSGSARRASGRSFFGMARDGFAYSLPILILALVYLFVLVARR